jgi:hypothetical protein
MSFTLRRIAFFYLVFFVLSDAAVNVVVVKDLARVLMLPYGDAKTLGFVRKGEKFQVVTKKDEWYNIEYKNTIGWIFQENVRTDINPEVKARVETAEKETVPPPPTPMPPPAPVKQQNSFEIKKPQEKPESFSEKGEARLKKPQPRQKKNQQLPVDLPPVSVISAASEKEKVLPVQDETNTVGSPRVTSSGQPSEPGTSSKEPAHPLDASNPPQVKTAHPVAKDTVVSPLQAQMNGEEKKEYFEIIGSSVKVLAFVSPESPILGIAHNNDCYVLLFKGKSWCKIRFKNAEGWVERRQGQVVDAPPITENIPRIVLFASIGLSILIIIILIIIFLSVRLRTKAAKKVAIRKDLLIIAHSEKEIQLSLTDSTTTLSKCFSEIGFKVSYASEMDHARNLLMHYLPDVIVVDWHHGGDVMKEVESVLANRASSTNILVIFYDVPDVSSVPQSRVIPNAHFLGISFSDREVFRLVTPLIISESETKSIRRSVESSALGGEIGRGNLIEVMQFIEIGRKTGCLYIVIEKPFGLIYFEQGRLTYAASQSKEGREAVFEILALKTGHFHFVLDKISKTKNVNLSTLEILMEWTKTVDEAHRS